MTSPETNGIPPINFDSEHMTGKLKEALSEADRRGSPIVATVVHPTTVVDPLLLYKYVETSGHPGHFWSSPNPAVALVGIGEVSRIEATGPGRFERLQFEWRRQMEKTWIVHQHAGETGNFPEPTGPVFMGGLSFFPTPEKAAAENDPAWDGYPDGLFVLPEIVYTATDEGAWLSIQSPVHPSSPLDDVRRRLEGLYGRAVDAVKSISVEDHFVNHPRTSTTLYMENTSVSKAAEHWDRLVDGAVSTIRSGHLEKVVVARDVDVRGDKNFSPADALVVLADNYPECFMFSFAQKGRHFIGATPERLVALRGDHIDVACLAGSAPRGQSTREDDDIGRRLLQDEKNLFEHRLVINMVRESLKGLVDTMRVADKPRLLKLRNVQHLLTPVEATVASRRDDVHILDFVEVLHPTPAVGGFPQRPSMDWLVAHEGFARGWYAAPVGWVGPEGDGEFVVAIRSALLRGQRAKLFAGCGIVSGSEKKAEFEESAMKLVPMMNALERSQR